MAIPVWEKWSRGLDAQRSEIHQRLAGAKLGHRADAILATTRVAAALRFPALTTKPAPMGASRVGGDPDLPDAAAWPEGMAFLLQLDLADLAKIPLTTPLPKKGLLSVFVVDGTEGEGDGDVEYLTEGAVLYTATASPKTLVRTKRPSKRLTKFPSRGVDVIPYLSLPLVNSDAIAKVGLPDEERDRYADDVYRKTTEPRHRLGGYDSDYYARPDVKKERLLFSIASSDALHFFWGDGDKLHFYVPEADWKRADFSNAHPRCATA